MTACEYRATFNRNIKTSLRCFQDEKKNRVFKASNWRNVYQKGRLPRSFISAGSTALVFKTTPVRLDEKLWKNNVLLSHPPLPSSFTIPALVVQLFYYRLSHGRFLFLSGSSTVSPKLKFCIFITGFYVLAFLICTRLTGGDAKFP